MSRKSGIRWKESDEREIERAVRNFNAKIDRITKKNPDMIDFLPSKVKKKDIIGNVTNRADFKRMVHSLQRFTKRGAEQPVKSSRGAKSTKWEVKEFKLKERIENARRTRERKKLEEKEVKTRGKGTGVTRAEMGSIKENSLKPTNKNFDNLSQKEWELAKQAIEKNLNENYRAEKKQKMKDNYIKGLVTAGYPSDLIKLVQGVDLDAFYETVETDQEATFDFIYDPLELKAKAEALYQVWENVDNG